MGSALSQSASAIQVVNYQFNTDTANLTATHPVFTLNNGVSASVVGGVANLVSSGGNSLTVNGSLPSTFKVQTQLGGLNDGTFNIGSDAPGLRVGNYSFNFFPGFGGGALQIRTINGLGAPSTVIVPDQSMGFTPAVNVLHSMEITVNGSSFNIKITNGSNPLQQGIFNFTPTGPQPSYVPGPIGFSQLNNFTGIYDNFIIEDFTVPAADAVPEPASFVLLAAGLTLAGGRRRRRAARNV